MRMLFAALLMLSLPAAGQELSDRYEVIGEMVVTLDGETMLLPVAMDLEKDRSFAEMKEFAGQKMLTITGVSANEAGSWAPPMVSLTIHVRGPQDGTLMSVQLSEAGRSYRQPTVAEPGVGTSKMQAFSLDENGAVALEFSAELIRMLVDAEYTQTPEEGQPPVVLDGSVSVVIPAEFRAKM